MAFTFTDEEKKSITRRQLNIVTENSALESSAASLDENSSNLLKVDQANEKFYNYYNDQVNNYENEFRQMSGEIPAQYAPSDVIAAAETPAEVLFFPTSPTDSYKKNIPCIQDGAFTNNTVKGVFHPTGTEQGELQIIDDPLNPYTSLTDLIDLLDNGISSSPAGTSSTTGSIAAGTVTSATLTLVSTTNFSVNDYAYINQGSGSGLYQITAKTLTTLTVKSIIPATSSMNNPTIDNSVSGFSSGERQTLSSGTYNNLLNTIADNIETLVNSWKTKLNSQLTSLNDNDDERTIHQTYKQAAILDVQNAISIIDDWLALPDTGVGAKFTSTGLSDLQLEMAARQLFIPTRVTQIESALGITTSQALSQSGETFTADDQTNRYYLRYKWLNIRINSVSGSLRRYYSSLQGKDVVTQILNTNVSVLAEYDQYFLTKKITYIDETNIIQVGDYSGLSVGDQVYVLSEASPTIKRVVLELMGTNQVMLDSAIPNSYEVVDLLRLYKEL